MGILNEWTGVAIEIYGFFRIEEHRLLWVDLDDEIFQGTQANHLVKPLLFLFRHPLQLTRLLGSCLGLLVHLLDQVIRIHYRALSRFHLTLRQFHHAIRQVIDIVRPSKAQLLQDELQDLEMIILFVSHDVDVRVEVIFLETFLRSAQVLRNVDRSAIGADEKFPVQAIGSQVAPNRAIWILHEDTHVQTFLNQ